MINAVLLFGGKSVEHDISVITYTQVLNAIDLKKYNVKSVYMDHDNQFYLLKKTDKLNLDKCNLKKCQFHKKNGLVYCNRYLVDVVINCVHGKGVEDGTLSAYFDLLGVSYTNSNHSSSSVFHNKFYTKLILNKYNINSVEYEYISRYEWLNYQKESLRRANRFSHSVVKPVNLGSSVGVSECTKENIVDVIDNSFLYDDGVIVEKKLNKFLELNQAIYKVNDQFVISKIEEVKNNSSIYDFIDKYENEDITRVVPARLSNQLRNKITKTTKKIGQIFNSKGVFRVDYLYDLEDQILYVNEVNVIPGALSYYLFEAKNVYFQTLIDDLVKEAFRERKIEDELITSFKSNVLKNKGSNKLK